MSSNNRNRRSGGGAVLGAAAAALIGAGTAHAVPDLQVSVDGIDLFPTAGNAATAESTFGNMAIASGVGATANASDGFGNIADATGTDADALTLTTSTSVFDSSWASGTNTLAETGNGAVDTAVATGTGSEALAGGGSFDTAIASQGHLAEATGSSGLFVVEPAAAAAAASTPSGPEPFEDLFGGSGINTWTPAADSYLDTNDPTLAASLGTSVEDFWNGGGSYGADYPITDFIARTDPGSFDTTPGLPVTGIGDLAVSLDYGIYASGLSSTLDPDLWQFFTGTLPTFESDALFLLFFPEDLVGIIALG
jgi:hypothetical protein